MPNPDIADYRKPLGRRPPRKLHGDIVFTLPGSMVKRRDEIALGMQFVSKRHLFGLGYQALHSTYYDAMPVRSGVMIGGFIPTNAIIPGATFPGDIDLLIIPFEDDHLVLSKTMAVELKAVRARFSRQGKSPNEFGFSQARALLSLGFPYAGVAHLIASDKSPPAYWRKVMLARVLDGDTGAAELLHETNVDVMPADLISRCYGRLVKNCSDAAIGLLAAYVGGRGIWMPRGREAACNPGISVAVMDAAGRYYHEHAESFLETFKYPPETPA